MKYVRNIIFISFGLLFSLVFPAFADQSISVYVDDEKLTFTSNPIIESGTTLVEFRPVFEKFGLEVGWDEKTQTVTGEKEGLKIRLQIGSQEAYVNGERKNLALAPKIVESRTLIPLRFVGEASGARVDWYEDLYSIHIRYDPSYQLYLAAYENNLQKTNELLASGADPNYISNGMSIIQTAAAFSSKNLVQALINNGLNLNAQDEFGYTPLMWAISFLRDDLVELFINFNSDLTTVSKKWGQTAVQLAEEQAANLNYTQEAKAKAAKIVSLLKETPDLGKIVGSTYSNNYFGLSLSIPKDWQIQDYETIELMSEQGAEVSGENENQKAMFDASIKQSLNLLTMYKYPLGTPVTYNPSFISIAEKVKGLLGIKSGQDYLLNTRIGLESIQQLNYEFLKEIYSEQISDVLFDIMEVQLDFGSLIIKQKYYSTIIKDYAFNFVISYSNQEELDALNEIIKSINFNVN